MGIPRPAMDKHSDNQSNEQSLRAHQFARQGWTLVDRPSVKPELPSQRNLFLKPQDAPTVTFRTFIFLTCFVLQLQIFPGTHSPDTMQTNPSFDFSFSSGTIWQAVQGTQECVVE